MSTITPEQEDLIRQFVMSHRLPKGLGSENEACSIASMNLALYGKLTDEVPECMSLVIGKWIIGVQDAMPDTMRNSVDWKNLLPLAAGTGRDSDLEQKRLALIQDWMWTKVLPSLQEIANDNGFGEAWHMMCTNKTAEAAEAAARAAARAAA
ncbi:MAG TPA: hypothetical protein VFB43_00920, partial [Terracidiphilus sp.]|nr:hypothetical protein [Terracidiphilus sp.]